MAIIDEVRRRAAQARFEAERLVRVNRTQTRISALQGQLSVGAGHLGALTLDLLGRGEVAHPELSVLAEQLLALRAQIEALDGEVRAIRAEAFVEEPTSITCPSCGTVSALDGRFCRRCGAPLQAAASAVLARPAVRYAPAPVVEPAAAAAPDVVCGRCAAANPPGMRFCVHCGTRLPIGTSGPAATAWSAGPPPGPAMSGVVPTSSSPSRSASREAPTVRMPTLGPAPVASAPLAASQSTPAPTDAVEANMPGQGDVADPHRADLEVQLATPIRDAASVGGQSDSQESRMPTPSAEPAPTTLPLRLSADDGPPTASSAPTPEEAPDHVAEAVVVALPAPVCPSCGEPVVEGATFCVTCGTRVMPA